MSPSFEIAPLNLTQSDHLTSYMQALGLPENSLGVLENVVRRLACIQNSRTIELNQLQHLVFCADHGVYDRSHQANLSTLSSTDHTQRLLSWHAPVAKACQQHHVDLTVIDCGLHGDEIEPHPNLITERIAEGSRDFSMTPAMSQDELQQAVELGRKMASIKMAEGARVLSFGALGLGNTTSAAAMTLALLPLSPEAAVANTNRYDALLNRDKVDVLTQAIELHRRDMTDGWQVARCVGGLEIAAIMGAMATTAELKGMFLIDGFACSAAMLALHSVYPEIQHYGQFAHQSAHTAQNAIMKHLGERPLLNLHLGLGEGTGSVMSWPLIESAVQYLR